jgi:hypothetical protein
MFQTGVLEAAGGLSGEANTNRFTNLDRTSTSGSAIFTDVGASSNIERSQTGGDVGNLVDSANTNRNVGTIFYKQGIVILDLARVISGAQHVSGVIGGMRNGTLRDYASGQVGIGTDEERSDAKFIPHFLTSGSIDEIVNHFGSCRFGSDSSVVATFQNETAINSTLFFCRAGPDEFNYSSNPTFTDSDGRINVIDLNQESTQKPFSFVTTVALHNSKDEIMAVAKLSRPVEKNNEKDITFRVRLDF